MDPKLPSYIDINIVDLTRCDELGTNFRLVGNEELLNALRLIQSACQKEADKRNQQIRDEYLAMKWHELKQLTDDEGQKARDILNEIADYEEERKKLKSVFSGLPL